MGPFQRREPANDNRQGKQRKDAQQPADNPAGIEFIEISAGPYVYGEWTRSSIPEAYHIGKYPVTVAQFAAFVQATGYQTTAEREGKSPAYLNDFASMYCAWDDVAGANWQRPYGPQSDVRQKANHPVTQISWEDAQAFCQWAHCRLPTDLEWEKAARGLDGRLYPWGSETASGYYANFAGAPGNDTTPVGKYSPQGDSPYGACDMSGNVSEWTSARELRGGGWDAPENSLRCASRYPSKSLPTLRNPTIGFRCVQLAGGGETAPANLAGIEWVEVPAGNFPCGEKIILVPVSAPFWIGKYPITNAQYKLFLDANPDQPAPRHWNAARRTYPSGKANHPVVYVSWHEAQAFCRWAKCRLPSEIEWGKAARGIDGRAYPWGDAEPAAQLCNFNKNIGDTTRVTQYDPQGSSPYGVCDLSGNVWEWSSSRQKNGRILCGGSWDAAAERVLCTARAIQDPASRYSNYGFRCAWDKAWLAGDPLLRQIGLEAEQGLWLGHEQQVQVSQQLVDLLAQENLSAQERLRIGEMLGNLGDWRPGVVAIDGMQFCYIPAGPFQMGDEREPYGVEKQRHLNQSLDYPYWIGRCPVTMAQWRIYLEANGLNVSHRDILYHPLNYPVYWITWDEALAFCRWLNQQYAAQIPAGYAFTLPSEAEWEKAARGGLTLPPANLIRALQEGLDCPSISAMIANPNPRRAYPWGDDLDPSRIQAAAREERRAPGVVGCFPGGASPYGLLDLIGNVVEYTRSGWGKDRFRAAYFYPYNPADGREDLAARPAEPRTARGGGYFPSSTGAFSRCATRIEVACDGKSWYHGFRVCVSRLPEN